MNSIKYLLKMSVIKAQTFSLKILAEEAGFEPALGYSPKHAFQACDLNRSSTLPKRPNYRTYCSKNLDTSLALSKLF